MRNFTLLSGLALALAITNISGCSSTKAAKPAPTKNKPVKYRVQTDTKQSKKIAKLSEAWEEKGVKIEQQGTQKVVVVKLKPKARPARKPVARRVAKRRAAQPRRVAKRRAPVKRYQAPRNRYKTPSYRAPVRNIRQASLTGDYANNNQTKSFINMMASKHGFDRGYLNYLFSKTDATPFLKRMAYADAFGGRKRSGKKARPGRWNRYRGNFLTPRTINKGIAFARANRVALQRAEDRYGVPKEYILGIIGVETRYGGNVGKNRAIDALSAMGFNNPRRGKYFRSELEAYLLMTRKERLDPLKPMASYAGALGLCQFMPSNIKRYAVDHDRSGTVNLWTPADAIGSVANYFKKHGWQKGGTVAVQANSINSGYRTLRTGFKSNHSLSRLRNKGVSARNLGNISGKASLIKLNTYSGDELWLGGRNFYVITRYNHSSHYAMAVHQLAQAIKGRIGGRGAIRQASSNIDMNKVLLALSK
ncbi:MAG: lytic murein transglycosylase B [Cocleimonas sp.]